MDAVAARFAEEKHTYPPAGECIYRDGNCGFDVARRLGEEHIVPEGVGGKLVLPLAACQYHERLVNEGFECRVQQFTLDALRNLLQIPSKRKRKRPDAAAADFLIGGRVKTLFVPFANYPVTITVPFLPIAGILKQGRKERTNVQIIRYQHLRRPGQKTSAVLQEFMADAARFTTGGLRFSTYTQFLAKVAHAFACAELGVRNFHPFLIPYILGDQTFPADHFIGGSPGFNVAAQTHSLRLRSQRVNGHHLWVCDLQLFGNLGFPEYSVIVGSAEPCPIKDLALSSSEGRAQWSMYQDELETDAYSDEPNLCFFNQAGDDGIIHTTNDVGPSDAVRRLSALLELKAEARRTGANGGLKR